MSNVFGFTAKRTMSAAQGLFEKGYITYHRTDSLALSPQFLAAAQGFINEKFGAKFLPEQPKRL
jgi:DNA topoisomerase I